MSNDKVNQQLLAALKRIMHMDVKGHSLQDRLQFTPLGRDILEECQSAIAAAEAAQSVAAHETTIKLGMHGKAFDAPQSRRAYTYADQPDNIGASKLGRSVLLASSGGDSIDYGLSLLKHLQDEGFGVFELSAAQKSESEK